MRLGGKLVSCAYDGVVRALDAEKAAFVELFASEDDDEFSACDVSADGREMHLVDNHGNYHRVDVRAGKLAAPAVQLHEKKINTATWSRRALADLVRRPDGVRVGRAQDGQGREAAVQAPARQVVPGGVLEPGRGCRHSSSSSRARRHPQARAQHTRRGGRAPPNGGRGRRNPREVRDNNQTGSVAPTPRRSSGPRGDRTASPSGSMRREVDACPRTSARLAAKLSDADRMTAIASRFAVHPSRNLIAAGTASGRVHIYR